MDTLELVAVPARPSSRGGTTGSARVVALPGQGFGATSWSVRLPLAHLPDDNQEEGPG